MTTATNRPALPQPLRKLGVKYVVLGVALAGFAVLWSFAFHAGGLGFLALAGGCAGLGLYFMRVGPAVVFANAAVDAIARGQLVEAESLLDAIPRAAQKGVVARALYQRRAIIALRRGDTRGAIDHATSAIEARTSWLSGVHARIHYAHALGIRALARASIGDEAAGRADVAALRARDDAPAEPLALASLAEAVLLSRGEDRTALAAHLTRDRRLLHEYTTPRERALVRALERLVKARATSAYREPAPREEPVAGNEPPLADWIASVAPAAAAFAPPAGARRASAEPLGAGGDASPASIARVEKAQSKGARLALGRRALALWVVLMVLFVAIWLFLTPSTPEVPAPRGDAGALGWLPFLAPVLIGAAFAYAIVREQRVTRRLLHATRTYALGDRNQAEALFGVLARLRGTAGANGYLQLAAIAEREGRFAHALVHCDAGIAKVAHLRAAASDVLLPELLARRAYDLAAVGRDADATTQIAALTKSYPGFAWLSRAQLRVRLMQAVRRGELDKARELARARTPDLPLDVRDEMLADMLVATAERTPAEVLRLDGELREDGDLRAWIEGTAPAVLAELAPLVAAAHQAR